MQVCTVSVPPEPGAFETGDPISALATWAPSDSKYIACDRAVPNNVRPVQLMLGKSDAEGKSEPSKVPAGPLMTPMPAGNAAHPLTDNVAVGVFEDVAGGLARTEPDIESDAGMVRDGDRLKN